MKFPFYIARRYLFARKSQAAVNILTLVSVIGVCVGTMGLIIVLSVYNGFEKLVLSLFNAFNPDLEIRLAEGKSFNFETFPAEAIRALPGVYYLSEVVEETALITYRNKQHIVKIRGVGEEYERITRLDTMLLEGEYRLETGDHEMILLGQGVAMMLGANIHDYLNPLVIYTPKRGRVTTLNPAQAFNSSANYASGVFAVHSDFDMEYVIAPLNLVRHLMEYQTEATSVVVGLRPGIAIRQVQRQIQQIVGADFVVRDRYQQEEFLYKVMRSEKWAIFLILSFILIIAAFNIIGSLTMLILEKRKDIGILWSMGASQKTIQTIFLFEGLLISIGGAMLGLLLGGLVCWLQIRFGLISIQAEGTFIIDAYPVALNAFDFLLVGITVFIIGLITSLLPVRRIQITSFMPE